MKRGITTEKNTKPQPTPVMSPLVSSVWTPSSVCRDRCAPSGTSSQQTFLIHPTLRNIPVDKGAGRDCRWAVSYTHLTLPTICSV
eukprot:2398419-Rhodomonas_salina.1